MEPFSAIPDLNNYIQHITRWRGFSAKKPI